MYINCQLRCFRQVLPGVMAELLENSEKLAENGDIDGSLALAKQVPDNLYPDSLPAFIAPLLKRITSAMLTMRCCSCRDALRQLDRHRSYRCSTARLSCTWHGLKWLGNRMMRHEAVLNQTSIVRRSS